MEHRAATDWTSINRCANTRVTMVTSWWGRRADSACPPGSGTRRNPVAKVRKVKCATSLTTRFMTICTGGWFRRWVSVFIWSPQRIILLTVLLLCLAEILCPVIPHVTNGQTLCNSREVGAECAFICNDSYERVPSKPASTTCRGDKTWTHRNLPECGQCLCIDMECLVTSLHDGYKQGVNRKCLMGNRFHVTIRIVSP